MKHFEGFFAYVDDHARSIHTRIRLCRLQYSDIQYIDWESDPPVYHENFDDPPECLDLRYVRMLFYK
jgi:hypothetical protein